MGHINSNMNVPFLPQPQLFLFQVEAEMRYQKQLLIDSSIAALDKIDKNCPFPDPAQRTQVLDVLMDKITIYQENVRRDIDKSCSIWQNFLLYKIETCATLEEMDTVGESVRRRVQDIQDIMDISKDQYGRIRDYLKQFADYIHDSSSSGLSYNGEFTTPRPLEPYIEETPFLIRQNNSGPNGSSVNSHPFVYSYNLGFDDGTPLPILRSKVAQLCQESENFNIFSGDLYMICAIQALEAMISDLNVGNVSGRPRSWRMQRQKALILYNQTHGFDEESMLKHYEKKYQADKKGISVPFKLAGGASANRSEESGLVGLFRRLQVAMDVKGGKELGID